MSDIFIRPYEEGDFEWALDLIRERWGSEIVVGHGDVYRPARLAGFVAVRQGEPVGLVTYQVGEGGCEIVTLDSLSPGAGIGSRLIERVAEEARRLGCSRLWLITTNDNLDALRFYQRRGFRMVRLSPGAVDASRALKPEIPRVGSSGIPIRDEIELELALEPLGGESDPS